jgi:AcrR family transcriptional regulator
MASAPGERTASPPIAPEEAATLWTILTNKAPETPRERLLVGMAASVNERGLAASTVADVVRHARASRRTFYEHFTDRDDCFLALYEVIVDRLVWLFESSIVPGDDWYEEIVAASRTYLQGLVMVPALARAGIAEMTSLGPRALEARTRGLRRLADVLIRLHDDARERYADIPSRPITPELALAIIAGEHELVLTYVQQDRIDAMPEELAPVCARMTWLIGVGAD